jgi:hypothetical protein
MSRPTDQARHSERALPVGVLLAAERRGAGIGPGVLVRTVVRGVEHDGVVGDAKVVHRLEDRADDGIVLDHAVGIFGPRIEARLVAMLGPHVRSEMHAGGVHPAEKRPIGLHLPLHEINGGPRRFVVDRLHPPLG